MLQDCIEQLQSKGKIAFSYDEVIKKVIPVKFLDKRKTETGYVKVSSPELTAFDLVYYNNRIGGLNRTCTVLKKKVRNYRKYFKYLVDTGILETDNQYIVGKKSKGYRFTPAYNTIIHEEEISKFNLVRQLNKERQPDPEVERKYRYLTKWWNPNFTIDYPAAIEFLDNSLSLSGAEPTFQEKDFTSTGNLAVNKYNFSYRSATEFYEQNFRPPSIDSTGNRMHNNITNMWNELNQFLRYDSQTLGSVDIGNSQPLFSTLFFHPNFYKEDNTGVINLFFFISSSSILHSLYPLLPIMLRNIHELNDNQDIKHYKELVENGLLYRYLEKEIKDEIFKGIYSTNYWIGQPSAGPKRIFRDRFPSVYEIFKLYKRIDKAHLPVLLQQIESHIVLDVICSRIAQERPRLPIWTKHDSIITTYDDILYVESVMHEELTTVIGHAPKLKIEKWEKKL